MIPTKLQIKAFEDVLDSNLSRRAIFEFDANEALLLAGNIVESAFGHDSDGAMYSMLSHGIHPYAGHLVSGRHGRAPEIEKMVTDLIFGAQYWSLREFIYYSYNAPGTIDWTIADDHIELRYADRSLPRQFFTVFNEWIMGSSAHFRGRDVADRIKGILKRSAGVGTHTCA